MHGRLRVEKGFYTTPARPLSTLTLHCHFRPSGELSKTGLAPITSFPGERGAARGASVCPTRSATTARQTNVSDIGDPINGKEGHPERPRRRVELVWFAAPLAEMFMQSGTTEPQTNQMLLPRQTITAVPEELFLLLSPLQTDTLCNCFRKKKTEGNPSKCTRSNQRC